MSPPLTFGVEFECSFAVLKAGRKNPNPLERRKVNFEENVVPALTIGNDIKNVLGAAGYPVTVDKVNIETWEVTDDSTIHPPDMTAHPELDAYSWVGIEIKSSAMYAVEGSFKAITDVLAILTSTYCINVNESTGLHVHVGDGAYKGFSFDTARKLAAFFCTYLPPHPTLPKYS